MSYAINVDIENLNYPNRHPTDCAFHPYHPPHFDVTIHHVRHARRTHRPHRYWIMGLATLDDARRRAEEERARWSAQELPVEIREHPCVFDGDAIRKSLRDINRRHGPALKKISE